MIRIATKEDTPIIRELIDALIKESVYSKMFQNYTLSEHMIDLYTKSDTRNEKLCILSLDENNKEVGIGVFDLMPWLYNDVPICIARLAYIYIKPEARGKGLGKEINQAFEHWGKSVGANWYSKGNSGKNEGYMKVEVVYMKEVK